MSVPIEEEIRRSLIADIANHLKEVGSKDWAPVRKRYPEIKERSFWRFVSEVKAGKTPEEILAAAVSKAKRAARKNLPAVPPPAYIAKEGTAATNNIDFMVEFQDLMHDAKLLRAWSTTEKEGGRSIKNPMYFTQSMALRLKLMETQIKAMREVWDLQRMQNFMDAVIDEIAQESPALRDRVLERIDRLNAELGMNIGG